MLDGYSPTHWFRDSKIIEQRKDRGHNSLFKLAKPVLFCGSWLRRDSGALGGKRAVREQAIQQLRAPEPTPEPELIIAPHINSRAAKRVAVSPEHAKERVKVMEKRAL